MRSLQIQWKNLEAQMIAIFFFFFFCLGLEKCTDHNCNSNTLRAMISNFTFVLSQSTPRDNTDYSGEKQHIKTTANKILNQYKFNLLFKM